MNDPGNSTTETITLRIHAAISEIAPEAWDACAGDINPTVSHVFLSALEESGSCTARSGWAPQHLSFADPAGRVIGVVPMYLKSHSYGEYVFDWGWADAFERAGGRYYPKLQVSVPFTPATGPRILTRPGPDEVDRKRMMAAGLMEMTRRLGASSAHVTFLPEDDAALLADMGFLHRTDQQFHWTDEGFEDFEGFLGALASRKRKAIRKERSEAVSDGIE